MKKHTSNKAETSIVGFKGFDKNLKCGRMQYEADKEFTQDGKIKTCKNGLLFCEYPLDVLSNYSPNGSRFCEVIGSGEIAKIKTSIACSKLKIGAEIGLGGLVQAALKFTFEKVKWTEENSATGDYSGASATRALSSVSVTGDYSGASVTGDYSGASVTGNKSGASATDYSSSASATGYKSGALATGICSSASVAGVYSGASVTANYSSASVAGSSSGASATGYSSSASATGYCSGASVTGICSSASATGYKSGASAGKGSVALATGMLARAKGDLGAFIVLTECIEREEVYYIQDVKAAKVDGKNLKPDTWYILKNGEFVIAED